MEVEVGHLPANPELGELVDVFLRFGDRLYLSHSQLLTHASVHIAGLISLSREQPGGTGTCPWRDHLLPVIPLLPAAPNAVPEGVARAGPEAMSSFLSLLYSLEAPFQWDSLPGMLELADYFNAGSIIQRADAWLAEQYRQQGGTLPPLRCCQAFELAARHRMSRTMALLLPWAVQCMARGSRCSTVWYDGQQCCARLRAAFQDSQLKCLILDAFWWSREAQEPCAACRCLPADVASSWDTRQEWAAPHAARGGAACLPQVSSSHARAVAHYAHLLREACWGCTPPGSTAGSPTAAAGARG